MLEAPQGRSHRNRSHLGDCSRRISRELICSKQSSAQPSSTEAELIGADPGVQARGRPPAARFVADSLLEGGVTSELVSKVRIPELAKIRFSDVFG